MSAITRTTTALLAGLGNPADEEAWRSFDERYRPILVGFAVRLGLGHADACDAAQETLLRFLREFRNGRYDRERGRLRSWLISMAAARVATLQRGKGRRREQRGESAIVDLSDGHGMDRLWEEERRRALLSRALDQLRMTSRTDPKTIRAFEMLFSHRLPPAVVAAELGMSVHDVYLAKSRVAAKLREIVEALEAEFEGET
jgi:RNA polymerase sigma-70 factor (ECF subfamily)